MTWSHGKPIAERRIWKMAIRDADSRRRLSIVFLPTYVCDCSCDYCFELRRSGHIVDDDWTPRFREMRALAERFEAESVVVYWQGGEILTLGIDSVRRGLDIADEVFSQTTIPFEHRLQTNLMSYNNQWGVLIRSRFGTRVGSSLDFPNKHRRIKNGKIGDYERVWAGMRGRAEADGVEVSVISLPNEDTLRLGAKAFYEHFAELGIKRLQVNPPFSSDPGSFFSRCDTAAYGRFFVDLLHSWRDDGRRFMISPLAQLEAAWTGDKRELPCIWSPDCSRSLIAMDYTGSCAQCDCWLSSWPDFLFGSVATDGIDAVLDSPARRAFARRASILLERDECGLCEYWDLCRGGCPVRAFTMRGDFHARDPYCQAYKTLFSAIVHDCEPGETGSQVSPMHKVG